MKIASLYEFKLLAISHYNKLPYRPFYRLISKLLILYGNKKRKPMIFGIGLSRTATSSLNKALIQLGYNSKHFPYLPVSLDIPFYYMVLNRFDAATDTPVAANFKKLDLLFPNSKFILTMRNIESWLQSCEKFFPHLDKRGVLKHKMMKELHIKLYNSESYDYDKFKKSFDRHYKNIIKYFEDKKKKLLILDIFSGEGFEKLCVFLGKKIPKTIFPYEHKTNWEKIQND